MDDDTVARARVEEMVFLYGVDGLAGKQNVSYPPQPSGDASRVRCPVEACAPERLHTLAPGA
jgi:hypothetical protein